MKDLKMYDLDFVEPAMTTAYLIRQTWTALSKAAETKLAKVGLTPEKLLLLWAARDYPFELTPAELGRLLFRENQTIAGLLNRMEDEGLIKRISKRKGRPYTQVKITPRGRELCNSGVKVYKSLILELSSDLSDKQRKQVHEALRLMRDRMLQVLHLEVAKQPARFPEGKPIPIIW
jgi:DNA-binding MarR family transcriptional regulator